MSACILLMTKAPRVGEVKSRLASEYGEEYAAGLYRCFLLDLLETLKTTGVPFFIYFTPADALDELRTLMGDDYIYVAQGNGDLGDRLYNGLVKAKELEYRRVLALASDVPDIPVEYLTLCVDSLESHDAVIGPSLDGGYNLIGLNLEFIDRWFFTGITWGTHTVFRETMDRLAGLDVQVLDPWGDIDKASDLEKLRMRDASHTMRYLKKMRLT